MAVRMREKMDELTAQWESRGYNLNFGVGIATGTATLGMTGFEGRHDYSAIGPVVNLAARLSDRADAGQILITNKVLDEVVECMNVESLGESAYKGFATPVATFNVIGAMG
jgi:class 3 adenylate cyclase